MSNIVPFRAEPAPPHAFDFSGLPVRVLSIDGDPWFVAKDVADVLGYADPRRAVAQHCRGRAKRPITDVSGRQQEMTVIPERDLYRLIMRSQLPSAERFEDWVVGTVLPAIRKDGSYIAGEEKVLSGEMTEDELMAKALVSAHAKLARIAQERDAARATIAAQAPAVAAQERLTRSEGSLTISDAARCLGKTQAKLFRWLQENGWIFRSKDKALRPVPYADKRKAGLMELGVSTQRLLTGEHTVQTAYVTPKGLAKLAEEFGVSGWEL